MKGNRSTPARVAAGLLPIVAASVLVTLRGVLDRADLVLILAFVVVSVATTGDRIAAAIGAVSAAASFDFFLTQPYGSLRISSAADLENTALLLVIGLAVGQIAILGRDQQRKVVQAQQELERLEVVAARIASDPNVWPLVDLVQSQIVDTLSLDSCRFGLRATRAPRAGRRRAGVRRPAPVHRRRVRAPCRGRRPRRGRRRCDRRMATVGSRPGSGCLP